MVEPNGESPMCDFYEARLMALLHFDAKGLNWEYRNFMAKRSVFQEMYDWFYRRYGETSKETLLKLMKDDVDIQRLRRLSQRELAEFYCRGLVYSAAGPDRIL